ncbi:hypothetical protein Cgig2_029740 [Carnegiea gigantea]|uniref:DUF4283 domain-containing protein n=1 Tax=Carnegiea gigantea TaxID=171969 RepID=A0A9Q1JZC3_9CARY|nr:hypothetical protein Cgig2_029740 [Carnegiea gigantea]
MASTLDSALSKMKLTDVKEERLDFDKPLAKNVDTQIALCLMGKLVLKTIKNIWKPQKGVLVSELSKNLFSFQFFSHIDKEAVLNEGPWAFDGHILLLKQLDDSLRRLNFQQLVCDLPMKKNTYAYAKFLGAQLGMLIDVDKEDLLAPSKYSCLKVDVDITKPLHRGMHIKVDGKLKWINLKYIKLPDFCYMCRLLGHVYERCELYNGGTPETDVQYSPKIRGSPIRWKRRGTEDEWKEKRMKLLGLGGGSGSRIRARANGREKQVAPQQLEEGGRRIKPSLVFLLETKLSGQEMKQLKERMLSIPGYEFYGGLDLLGADGVVVTLLSQSLHHVDVSVQLSKDNVCWRFLEIYG